MSGASSIEIVVTDYGKADEVYRRATADIENGSALRRLHDALPEGWSMVCGFNPAGPHWWVEVRKTWDQRKPPYLARHAPTIAGAVDKCMEVMGW